MRLYLDIKRRPLHRYSLCSVTTILIPHEHYDQIHHCCYQGYFQCPSRKSVSNADLPDLRRTFINEVSRAAFRTTVVRINNEYPIFELKA